MKLHKKLEKRQNDLIKAHAFESVKEQPDHQKIRLWERIGKKYTNLKNTNIDE